MRGLFILREKSGVLFRNNPANNPRGEILSICSSKSDSTGNGRSTISNQISAYHFSPGGYKLYFALNSGDLYCLDFAKNWYQLIASLNRGITYICLCEPRGYVLLGLNDNSIRILDEGNIFAIFWFSCGRCVANLLLCFSSISGYFLDENHINSPEKRLIL
ncbi:unnamed protein product [Schistosoma curassoni]|nr:unnamed protein product [Schistosoma curassoni]